MDFVGLPTDFFFFPLNPGESQNLQPLGPAVVLRCVDQSLPGSFVNFTWPVPTSGDTDSGGLGGAPSI